MNKNFLKILIATLILLIGIGAVSAIDSNSTDEVLSLEQDEVISISDNSSEVLTVADENDVISVSENDSGILSAENNSEVISVSEDNDEILSGENNNEVISVSNDNDLTASSPFAKDPQGTQSKTEFKTFYSGKMVFLKKYKKMLNGYKIPSKKNKKAYKKHIAFVKAYKKQLKKLTKYAKKVAKKASANHWYFRGDPYIYYKIKYSGKYIQVLYYAQCYRTYNYNPLLNKGWWD